ncbi:MAG TPA: VOC family protein [Thermoanaerobaculia bacterium]|nr:VOC family protein [Thermoanaerobaculia bacterium]
MVSGYPLPACPSLVVRDLAASIDWYVSGPGFRLVFSTIELGDEPPFAHLRWAESSDLVLTAEEPQIALAGGRGLGVTLRFATPGSIDALAEKVRARGIEILIGPVDRPWKAREFIVADPDGYHLAFTGRLEDKLPTETAIAAEIPTEQVVVMAV